MHTRSSVARTPIVPPAQPSVRQSASQRLSASAHDRTWPATKAFLRRQRNPVSSALCQLRVNCWLASIAPRRLIIVEDCDRLALSVFVLSGFPTSGNLFFSQCAISRRARFVTARSQRPRNIPLAREDIPDISHLTRSITPPGADVIQFRFLSRLAKGVVQYGKRRESIRLVGP